MFTFLIVCKDGFTGRNCSETCAYPGYGRDCQMTCHCIHPFCSHINGCNTSNEGTITCTLCHDLIKFMIKAALFIIEQAKKLINRTWLYFTHSREPFQICLKTT